MNSDDINENNNANLTVIQTILRATINNCIRNILLDSGAQVSLVNESFIHRNKNKFGNLLLLRVVNTIIHTVTNNYIK